MDRRRSWALPHNSGLVEVDVHMQLKNMVIAVAMSAAVLVGGAALVGCSQSAAPDSTFVLLDGSRQTTADMRGKVTLVNFWATPKPANSPSR